MAYCTVEQARAAGAVGTDAEVAAAVSTARAAVDRFTRAWWEPTPAVVLARVGRDGFTPLPYPVQTVDSVTPEGSTNPLPSTAYWVVAGEPSLVVRGWGADPLIVGAEPWRGGYANLTGGMARVSVAGTFGHPVPPPEVTAAACRLAAWVSGGGMDVDPTAPDVDAEGNALVITTPGGDTVEPVVRTTGLPEADRLLAPLLTEGPVLIS